MSKKISSLGGGFIAALLLVLAFGVSSRGVLAQASSSVLYVPLVGITSVPEPLALPGGAGSVTYSYAVKNFLRELPLADIVVVDDRCSRVEFVTGDDNGDSKLDYSETWRYACTTRLSTTTQSMATVTGSANGIAAAHRAYATVVVGSSSPAPLVSIVNITKVAYPLSLPAEGGKITFTYRLNNPGVVPLSNVAITDDRCSAMSGKLGDTNGNNLLDTSEVWIYTCTMNLRHTTTNTARVTAFANGLKAVGDVTITVKVDTPNAQPAAGLPDVGGKTEANSDVRVVGWVILSGILVALIVVSILTRKGGSRTARGQRKLPRGNRKP